MEFKITLSLLILPQMRERLIVNAQFKLVSMLNNVQSVFTDVEGELEGSLELLLLVDHLSILQYLLLS